jgi:serine/threonine-protein phosphatase 6 regulatory subunit 3
MATEVLCSDIWSIVESCVAHSEQLLTPFWETVLETPPENFKEPTLTAISTFFAKVNAVFLSKKPTEVNHVFELYSAYTVVNIACVS